MSAKHSVDDIVTKNESASSLTNQLHENTKSMETIVALIRDISEQVNLLALNATIEAARAGEAGKGFAVVAGEVKSLATETAKATELISKEILSIQEIVNNVVQSSDTIAKATNGVGEDITAIASAIEEQTAVTGEISRSMQKIGQNVESLDECIQKLAA